MNLQPSLYGKRYELLPLKESDFPALFAVASDPYVWSQHPNPNRYQEAVFRNFFEGALESGGAFKVRRKEDGAIVGSTRFYDYDSKSKTVLIGYTFYGAQYWGQGVNQEIKTLMLDYGFDFVDQVIFHVGRENFRSHRAMEKLGALVLRELEVAYHGEESKVNLEYSILKSEWLAHKSKQAR